MVSDIFTGRCVRSVSAATIGPAAAVPEIRFILEDSGARVLFVDAALEEKARSAAAGTSVERIIVLGDAYEAILAAASSRLCLCHPNRKQVRLRHQVTGVTARCSGWLD